MSSQPTPTGPSRKAGAWQVIQSVVAPQSTVWSSILVVLLAFITALVVSAVFVIVSDPTVFGAPDLLTGLGNAGRSFADQYLSRGPAPNGRPGGRGLCYDSGLVCLRLG